MSDENTLTREPFEGFSDVSDEHRALSEKLAQRFAPAFAEAKFKEPTPDHAILATHLQLFAEQAMREGGPKPSAIVRRLFDDSTETGRATGMLLAGLLQRMYQAPYGSINEAALDLVNVLVPALEIAASSLKPKLKHGGVAKGKRPS